MQDIFEQGEERFADYTFFLHDYPFDHIHWNHMRTIFTTLEAGHFDQPYYSLSESRMPLMRMDQDFCETLMIRKLLELTEEFNIVNNYCCGQFLVRKDRLNFTSWEIWNSILDLIANMRMFSVCGHPEPHLRTGFTLEMLYHVLFGEQAITPIREEDKNLPLYLRVARQFEHSVFPDLPSFGDDWGNDHENVVF